MTQPNDQATPDDGATAYLGRQHEPVPDEPTVHLGGGDATVHLGGGDATVHLGGGDGSTVRLNAHLAPGPRTAGEPTGAAPTRWTTVGRAAPTGPGTVAAGRSPAPPVGAPTPRTPGGGPPETGGEVRFGPGVPATPPSAPAWPAAAPPPRRRPLWRRVTSVLSALLTVVLVAIVGLYLWQRLSPLEITGVSVAVPEPAGTRCDVTVDVVATVTTNGRAGEIRYQWLRSGSAPGTILSERVGYGQRTARLTLRWSFSGVGSTAETATVNIVEPTPAQARTAVAYDCRG